MLIVANLEMRDVHDRKEPKTNTAERLDVRTKLAMLAVVVATGAIVKDYRWGSVLFAAVALLSFAIGRGRMAARFAGSYLLLMAFFWLTTLLPAGMAGALGSFALACRTCMPILLFAAVFASSTKIGDMTAALYGLRLPQCIVVPFSIAVRFFPTLAREASAVADAMRLRGLGPSLRNIATKPTLMFESLVVPIMLRCAKIADELAAAAVARGIDRPGKKTPYNAPRFGLADAAALAAALGFSAALVAVKLSGEAGGLL